MLAEPRSKQKWSDDPRNTRWSNDKTKFGYQMLSKMGWSEGQGLGAKLSGSTSHVKVSKKKSASGLGSTQANDDNWIAHQDDFNILLGALNQKNNASTGSESKIASLEDRVKKSKKKIMYHKFVKSKDLSRASSHDLACIFGQRSKSAPSTPQISDDEAVDSDASTSSCPPPREVKPLTEQGIQLTTSSCNMHEYFARKMAAIQQARILKLMQDPDEEKKVKEDQTPRTDDDNVKLECRKKKKSKNPDTVQTENDISNDPSTQCAAAPKKKKKKKHRQEEEEKKVTFEEDNIAENSTDDNVSSDVVKRSKKKKKSKEVDTEEDEVPCQIEDDIGENKNDDSSSTDVVKKSKKKTKSKDNGAEENRDSCNVEENLDTDLKVKKKKKKVKEAEEDAVSNCELNENENGEEGARKKKNKKRKHSKEPSEERSSSEQDYSEHWVKKKKKKKHNENGGD